MPWHLGAASLLFPGWFVAMATGAMFFVRSSVVMHVRNTQPVRQAQVNVLGLGNIFLPLVYTVKAA